HTPRTSEHPGPDSDRVPGLRRARCCPLHHQDSESRRLDSHQHEPTYEIGAFLRRATSARAAAQGFEPCPTALETACSPRSTLLYGLSSGYLEGVGPSPSGSQP